MIGFSNDTLNIIQIIVVSIILLGLYIYWGIGICRITKYKCHWSLIPVFGFVIEYFLYILVEVPFCIFDLPFNMLTWIHLLMMIVYSVIIFKKYFKNSTTTISSFLKMNNKELVFVVIIAGGMALFAVLNPYYAFRIDGPWNCNNISTMLSTNHIFRHDPESGQYVGLNNPSLYFYTYFPYLASLCKFFYIKPVIVYSFIINAVIIYIYSLTAYAMFDLLFEGDKRKKNVASVLFICFNIVYSYAVNASYAVIMGRGFTQAVTCGIFAPLTVYMLLKNVKYKEENFWLMFSMVTISSTFVNRSAGMSVGIIIAVFFVPYIVLMKKNTIKTMFKFIAVCIPAMLSIYISLFY